MSWIDDIKNEINQIIKNEHNISDEFLENDNLGRNNSSECYIACIFVDIAGYSKFCEKSKNVKKINEVVITFHYGVLEIMNHYNLKNIQIQGDGIFGVLQTKEANCENAKKILNCAKDINGYLWHFWKKMNYRISISENNELITKVGNKKEKQSIFAGGAVNEAKNQMKENRKNCILINDFFKSRNEKIFNNEEIEGKTNKKTWYSFSKNDDWE